MGTYVRWLEVVYKNWWFIENSDTLIMTAKGLIGKTRISTFINSEAQKIPKSWQADKVQYKADVHGS